MALAFAVLDARRHDRECFASGLAVLNDYLRRRAGPDFWLLLIVGRPTPSA